jgi:hypothetical protein
VRVRSLPIAALLALTLVAQPPIVAAQTDTGDAQIEQFNEKKFWDYAACAASIVFAAGTGGWVLAVMACAKAVTEHFTD